MSLKRQAVSGVKWTTAASLANVIGSLARVAVLARFLEKQDFGLMALVLFVLGLTNLFSDMGVSSAILHKQQISRNEYDSLYWLNTLISIGLYAIVAVLAIPIGAFYDEPELPRLLIIMGTNLLVVSLGSQFRVIEQKNLNFRYIAIVEVLSLLFSVAASILMATQGYGVMALVLPSILQSAIATLVFLCRGIKTHGLGLHFAWHDTIPFLKIGSFRVGSQVINYFNKGLDTLLIGKLLGVEALGPYSIAKQFVFRPQNMVNPVLTRVASPVLARYQDHPALLSANYLKLLKAVASLTIPLYLFIILLAPIFVPVLYGSNFPTLVPLIQILSGYMIFRSLGNPTGSLIVATGRTELGFRWNLFTLCITPIFLYLGSSNGVAGVAISILLSQLLLYIPAWWFLTRPMVGISLKEYVLAAVPSPLATLRQIKK